MGFFGLILKMSLLFYSIALTLLTSETVQSSLEIPQLWLLLQVQPGQSITIAVSTPKKTKFMLNLFPRERGGNNVALSMPKVA